MGCWLKRVRKRNSMCQGKIDFNAFGFWSTSFLLRRRDRDATFWGACGAIAVRSPVRYNWVMKRQVFIENGQGFRHFLRLFPRKSCVPGKKDRFPAG